MRIAIIVAMFMASVVVAQQPAPTTRPANLGDFQGNADVGKIDRPGSVEFAPADQTYRVTGSGANIWAKEDAFHFVYRKASGDLEMTAGIAFDGEGKNAHRKACLMVRQSLAADAAYADIAVHGEGLICLQYRKAAGEITEQIQSTIKGPGTVKLQRKGDVFTVWAAAKGEALQKVGEITLALPDPVYAGFAVSSHDATVTETAIFSAVKTSFQK